LLLSLDLASILISYKSRIGALVVFGDPPEIQYIAGETKNARIK